jgi:DNA topoisomerase VI subunit B
MNDALASGVSQRSRAENAQFVQNGVSEKSRDLADAIPNETFLTPRDLDYFTRKGLEAQTGSVRDDFHLSFFKEAIDNGLDACEDAGIPPVITISVEPTSISVHDNGPGLPGSTLLAAMDFNIRASSREAVVTPTRGRQGNGLKPMIAMPSALDEFKARFVVTASGKRNVITCDTTRAVPVIRNASTDTPTVGTEVRIEWDERIVDGEAKYPFNAIWRRIHHLVAGYAMFNPHATFHLSHYGGHEQTWTATDTAWGARPESSPHWYDLRDLERLIKAIYSHNGAVELVSNFLERFDGLRRSAKRKKVLNECDLHRTPLSSLFNDGALDIEKVGALLRSMQKHTKPVRSVALGVIGEDHITHRLLGMGCVKDSIQYTKIPGKGSMPFVIEAAFGWLGEDAKNVRRELTGTNRSACTINPFNNFAESDTGLECFLGANYAYEYSPIAFVLHLAHPKIHFTNPGKTALAIGHEPNEDDVNTTKILEAVTRVTKAWTRLRVAEERGSRSKTNRAAAFTKQVNCMDLCEELLPAGYLHASGDGKYTVSKRTFYYAVREEFKKRTNKYLEWMNFCKKLLPKYMNTHPETESWKVTADPRGTLHLPNATTPVSIPCGTLAIDDYLAECGKYIDPLAVNHSLPVQWPSLRAGVRYKAVLYVEKEGFQPMLEDARISERFEMAVLSCKGQSVVAARKFVDEVCRALGGVPLYILHDFDKSGFEISQCLTDVSSSAREAGLVMYEFKNEINVTDLGLRLEDAKKYKLQSETCKFRGKFSDESIATKAEQAYLMKGRRVELNAFTAPQFIEWVETKLVENGLTPTERLVPDEHILGDAWKRAILVARANKTLAEVLQSAKVEATKAKRPAGLEAKIRRAMKEAERGGDFKTWDEVLYDFAYEKIGGAV